MFGEFKFHNALSHSHFFGDSETEKAIEARERELGIKIPLAIKELYCRFGEALSDIEERIPASKLGDMRQRWEESSKSYIEDSSGLIILRDYCGNLVYWFVPLNGEEDPPVLGEYGRELWLNHYSYSSCMYDKVLLRRMHGDQGMACRGWALDAESEPPDEEQLELLQSQYLSGPVTLQREIDIDASLKTYQSLWMDASIANYRFLHQYCGLWIRTGVETKSGRTFTRWYLRSATREGLKMLANSVWEMNNLGDHLKVPEPRSEHGRETSILLHKLRRSKRSVN